MANEAIVRLRKVGMATVLRNVNEVGLLILGDRPDRVQLAMTGPLLDSDLGQYAVLAAARAKIAAL